MDGDYGYRGKHNMLRIVEHSSVPLSPQQIRYQKFLKTLYEHNHKATAMPSLRLGQCHLSNMAVDIEEMCHSLSLYDDNHRVVYPLPPNFDLRFYRQWDWLP